MLFGVSMGATMVRALVTRGVKLMLVTRQSSGQKLSALMRIVESGAIRPVIDRVFPLEEVAEAHRYLETGRAKGKVILSLSLRSGERGRGEGPNSWSTGNSSSVT